jgi:5-(carboxyamino)imidazole ribonucleotide synthase
MHGILGQGATVGVLGTGAMLRDVSRAAVSLGYRVRPLDAARLADRAVAGEPERVRALVRRAARGCAVVIPVQEELSAAWLGTMEEVAAVRPGPLVFALAQDRAHERAWLERRGVRVGAWRAVSSAAECAAAVAALGGPCYVKRRVRGPGAPGPILVSGYLEESLAAWRAIGGRPAVVEAALDVDMELSVIVARSASGAVAPYAPAVSHREHTRLVWSTLPAPVPRTLAERARSLAAFVAAKLQVVGLLAVELFVLRDGRLVVNELVPCPHHTYVASELAFATGQCEQLVRAAVGLPLGSTRILRPSASVPLPERLRDLAHARLDDALEAPEVRVTFHGDVDGRAGGHLCAPGDTPADAVDRALRARLRLEPSVGMRWRARQMAAVRRQESWQEVERQA